MSNLNRDRLWAVLAIIVLVLSAGIAGSFDGQREDMEGGISRDGSE